MHLPCLWYRQSLQSMSSFLYTNAMADHSFHTWSKYGIKKEPQRVIHTMAHQSKISYFSSDTGSFHSKGQNRLIASFFCTQKPIFEKARKWAIKREKRRKTCVFQGASFLYALRGGASATKGEPSAALTPPPPNATSISSSGTFSVPSERLPAFRISVKYPSYR